MRLGPGDVAPSFTLRDRSGSLQRFHSDDGLDHTLDLLVFWKHDCATCDLVLPVMMRVHEMLASSGLRVRGITQSSAADAAAFAARHDLRFPILDDSTCEVSADYGLEIVPTLILTDRDRRIVAAFDGWVRADFDALIALAIARLRAAHPHGAAPAPRAADVATLAGGLPEFRPGCGSRNLDPELASALDARRAKALLRARRIEVGDLDDALELFFDRGLTDGLPIVPPTEGRVLRMLDATSRRPDEIVAHVPPNLVPVTVEKIAINAVMAGCKPDYFPVVLATIEAACDERFNLHGVVATTYFPAPMIIVNGPVRHAIGMNSGHNALGQGNRANATIGRALPLVIRNVGGGRPGEIDKCTLGHPGKYTYCFAENEEANPWQPLHVERGFAPTDSTVTLFAAEAPRAIMDQASRTARSLAASFAQALAAVMHPKLYGFVDAVLVIAPEHVQKLVADGWGKAELRAAVRELTARPLRELLPDERCAEGIPAKALGLGDDIPEAVLDMPLSKFRTNEQLTIVVAGSDAGMFSAIIGGWVAGEMGSQMVTRKIEL